MNINDYNPKERFSSRAENYSKYRLSYPKDLIVFLKNVYGFDEKFVIADIGAGTGILTKLFLDNGNKVYAVEPNKEMRDASEEALSSYDTYNSICGSSDKTNLKAESIDLISVAQAFHWFDLELTKKEFLRILKPDSPVIILWNDIKVNSSEFMTEYKHIRDKYSENLNLSPIDELISSFLKQHNVHKKSFHCLAQFNYERLIGEITSHSYMPKESHDSYNAMKEELEHIFRKYNENGKIVFEYETHLRYSLKGFKKIWD
ncbi:class I SAM-dependent methyltransferase [Vallitalea okinawensis]|uniref:class I SAM-dependent methyltransferase n=1 Tax=Vallitalea okinawensis TaxID=2078660 RepID=UPI000CFB3D92|nr:class I SAM-dependent methyltransferase [Vallitalea okinawensis]